MPDNLPTVLVVEDDPLLLIDARFVLENAGFAVVEAPDADAACAMLGGGVAIDAVISDVRLGGSMDGVDLARHIRRHWPDIRIVLTTGAPEEVAPPADVELIAKPYRPQQLTRSLASLAA